MQGIIDLTVIGAYPPFTFSWMDNQTTEDNYFSIPSVGMYSVTVTDSLLCEVSDSVEIVSTNSLAVTLNPTYPNCPHIASGSIIANPTGGMTPYSYQWSNGEITQEITGLNTGIYSVTVTDNYGCLIDINIALSSISSLTANYVATPPTCPDSNGVSIPGSIDLTISNGIPNYSVLWSTGSVTEDIDNLYSGTYSVTVVDSMGCDLYDTVTLGVPSLLIDFDVRGQGCNGIPDTLYEINGQIIASVTGGVSPYSYHWSNQATTDTLIGLIDSSIYTLTVYDSTQCSGIDSTMVISEQDITLPFNWSIWSTYIDLSGVNVADYFYNNGLASEINIMKNDLGEVYYPAYNNFGIGNFSVDDGYHIKMLTAQDLHIEGSLACPEDIVLDLDSGWHLIPYLRTEPKLITEVFSTITGPPFNPMSLEIVKDGYGGIYWPYYTLNTIVNMHTGKGYQLKMNVAEYFNYPDNDTVFGTKSFNLPELKSFNNFTNEIYINNDNFMIIGFPQDSWEIPLQIGDEIAAIGEAGQIVGKTIYEGGFTAMVIYGDDYYTPNVVENLTTNEAVTFVVWDSNTKAIRNVEIKKWARGNNYFADEKISVAGIPIPINNDSLKGNTTTIEIYPNPNKGIFRLNIFSNMEDDAIINVYNLSGQIVYTVEIITIKDGWQEKIIDLSQLSNGSYYLSFETKNEVLQEKLLIIK